MVPSCEDETGSCHVCGSLGGGLKRISTVELRSSPYLMATAFTSLNVVSPCKHF
jgi:hypothetical protein